MSFRVHVVAIPALPVPSTANSLDTEVDFTAVGASTHAVNHALAPNSIAARRHHMAPCLIVIVVIFPFRC